MSESNSPFDPRALVQDNGFLRSESGDFFWLQNGRYYHVPSEPFKIRIKNERNLLMIVFVIAFTFVFNSVKLIELHGLRALVIYLALICFFILYRIAGLFLVRHLDVAGKQSFFDNQESRAKRFHPLFLAACAAFFLGCSLYFATFIPVAYKNYVYYREQITPLEPASAPKPAAEPVKPSAEYLQWMKDNNLTEDHMKGFASGLYDYAQNEKAHNLVMAKDSFYSLMLSPILPLLMLVMGCVCAFWTRLSWDAYR